MKRIYLYLFVFSFVINIFQYINDSNVLKAKEEKINQMVKELKVQKDSIQLLNNQLKGL